MNRMNKKMFQTLIIVLLTLLVAGAGALVFVFQTSGEEKEDRDLSLEEMVEYSFETEELNTDLEDGSFVRIQFQIIADSPEAKEEVKNRAFQFKNMLIKELSVMDRDSFKTGLTELEERMKNKLNEVMEEGKVTDVYTVNKVLQ